MTPELVSSIGQYGLVVVVANVFVEQIGVPVPAIPTLILAGALAGGGQPPLSALFACSVIACLVADCGWYLVGQKYGIRVLKTLCKISLEPDSCVSQTQTRFERWGVNSLDHREIRSGPRDHCAAYGRRSADRLAALRGS